jgi:pimeloyl-ACP methyl ester carboxylesterase
VEGNAQCGTYTVYEDRERKTGRTIDIGLIVLRALEPSPELDPLVVVAGGPGQSVTPLASTYNRRYAQIRRHRDILLIDQRGTGRSNSLACDMPLPRGSKSLFGSLFPSDHIEQCLARLESRADPRHYTTPIAADDMDEIRGWLGYDRVNLTGGSYGTRFVQIYLCRHPEHVRTAILNGVVPVHRNIYLHGAKNLDRAVERFIQTCENDRSCSEEFPDFRKHWIELVTRLENETKDGFGRGDFAYAVRGMLYGPLADEIPQRLKKVFETSDFEYFSEYYLERASWVASSFSTGMHLSVVCSEDVAFTGEDEIRKKTEGTVMGDELYRRYENACRIWPQGVVPDNYHDPIHSSVSVLLLSGEWDPVTPPSWGDEVAEHLPNSLHLVVPRAGHGVGGSCITKIENHFITTGKIDVLDTSCIGN